MANSTKVSVLFVIDFIYKSQVKISINCVINFIYSSILILNKKFF